MDRDKHYYYEVGFDTESYKARPGVMPIGPVDTGKVSGDGVQIVKNFFLRQWDKYTRNSTGSLKYPFLVPGATYNNLWDWDSYFMACAVPDEGLEYVRGCVLNFVTNIGEDGRPPKMANPEGKLIMNAHPYPVHAQFAYLAASRLKDFSWVEPLWDNLIKIIRWHENKTLKEGKYFTWLSMNGNGIDNNPSVYGRPPFTSAGIDLACWHYREYRAMEKISKKLEKHDSEIYTEKAEKLKFLIQKDYWDVIDQFFYSVDCSTDVTQTTCQKANWITYLKFRSWASLFPLWAKAATDQQAAILKEKILSEKEFLSVCGIRSHSAIDPVYNNVPMGNPSNWQGPVWGLSTFLTAYGLAKYGCKEEARDICRRMTRTFAADILQNGCVHEFYHGDTGNPVSRPGFASWNMLAINASDDIEKGIDCTTLDLLD